MINNRPHNTERWPVAASPAMATTHIHSPAQPSPDPHHPQPVTDGKRQRVSRACDKCRRKKVKCDGKRPICTHCAALGESCTYLDATKKRGPPKGYIEVIENRLRKVEELLYGLIMQSPTAAKYVLDDLLSSDAGEPTVVSDSSGKLFGLMTMDELESKARASSGSDPLICQTTQMDANTDALNHDRNTTVSLSNELKTNSNNNNDEYAEPSLQLDMDTPVATPNLSIHGAPTESANQDYQQQSEPQNVSMTSPLDRTAEAGSGEEEDCAENLTRLEKRVGHLTLDQSGSLRYLGNSSGWYIINRSLMSSESSPRLTKGLEGVIRWPPISTMPTRDGDSADASCSTKPSQRTVAGIDGAKHTNEATPSTAAQPLAQTADPSHQTHRQSSQLIPVPRNMPPSGKPPMPDSAEQAHLLSLYFRYVHPVFPILYKSHFLQRAFDKDRPQSPALMSAVFAAASTYKAREASNEGELARARIQMVLHFQRAKMYLDEQYTQNSTAIVLTLLLMSVYEQGTMSTRSWLYSGMAIRKAYDLGMHRDMGMSKSNVMSVVSRTEAEIRQRAWWGCYIMDIMVSATLGRPTSIRDFTFDAPYPTRFGEDDDELLLASSSPIVAGPAEQPQSASQNTTQEPKRTIPVAERMREYVALTIGDSDSEDSDSAPTPKSRPPPRTESSRAAGEYYLDLLHVLGHVLTEMYTCKPHRSYASSYCLHDINSRGERLIVLDHELRRWKESLPQNLQYPIDDILAARPARSVYIALIHLVYHTALILLHRPFISKLGEHNNPASPVAADESMASSSDLGSPGGSASSGGSSRPNTTSPLPSHSICTLSAQMISLIGQAIIQHSRVYIMPFLTFMMFTAGTMHLNNVIVAAESWLARRFLKRTLDVMSRLGAHWQVSYKCYTMLSTLVRANRIGLDQVIDDPQAGIRAIKDREREVSDIAHFVYKNRAMYRGRQASSKMGTAQTSSQLFRKGSFISSATKTSATRTTIPTAGLTVPSSASRTSNQKYGPSVQDHAFYDEQSSIIGDNAQTTAFSNPGKTANVNAGMDVDTDISTESRKNSWKWPSAASREVDTISKSANLTMSNPNMRHDSSTTSNHQQNTEPQARDNRSTSVRPINVSKIFALRNSLDKDGNLIVPPSPFTSVDFNSNDNRSAADLMRTTYTTEHSSSSRTDPAGVTASSSSSLGQFVPSLEFFANADFPLGIGGPNGQISLAPPPRILARKNTSATEGVMAEIDEKRNTNMVESSQSLPFTPVSTSTHFTQGSSASAAPAVVSSLFSDGAAGIHSISNVSQGGRNISIGNNGDVHIPHATTLSAETSQANGVAPLASFYSSNLTDMSINNTGEVFGYNSNRAIAAPSGLEFGGMLIDNDVMRNLPFTGPVSFDLSLAGMGDPSSFMAALQQQQQHCQSDVGTTQRSEPNGINTIRNADLDTNIFTAIGSAPDIGTNDGSGQGSDSPWKDYVSQVIRMFSDGYQTNQHTDGSQS